MRDDGDDAGVDVGPESWDFNVLAAAERYVSSGKSSFSLQMGFFCCPRE
jgi:hypothetical protein